MFSEKSFWTSANIFCRECENHFLKFMRTICVGKQNVHMVSPMWKIAEEKKNQPMEKFSFLRKFIKVNIKTTGPLWILSALKLLQTDQKSLN